MPTVRLDNGCLRAGEGEHSFILSAEEIYGVVFENRSLVRGVSVSLQDLRQTGLAFSEFSADPTIVLSALPPGQPADVECRFKAKAQGFEADVSEHEGAILDYAVAMGKWVPLPKDAPSVAQDFLQRMSLARFGPISLAQYLKIIQSREPALVIDDRTHKSMRASELASTLKGEIPSGFSGTLYPYQADGFRWLSHMNRGGLGCIIADEMGLGKTVQIICLLLEAKNDGRGPNIVICPATLLENWLRELSRFAPQLKAVVHRGPKRTGFPDDLRGVDVVLTSFETAVADVSLFRNIDWKLLVIDEAQGIKNAATKRRVQLRTIPRQCAIAVTGTPVENHLTDLWSLADFVVPSLLGPLQEFERNHPDTPEGAASLEPIVTPLILRRLVSDVAADLPPRIDIPQPLELDHKSAQVYEALRMTASDAGGASLATLTKLRMFCTHPWLAGQFSHVSAASDCSVKLQRMLEIFEEIVASGSKVIVFTSYQESIDLLLREIVMAYGIRTDAIDGRVPVPERQPKVDAFTAHQSSAALILNPKAAGTGLNITAASHVIHFNLEWNPAVEDQASARAHRRGQGKTVTVHRLFYIDTVEDVINDRMTRKREIAASAVIGTDGTDADAQDILRALRVSPLNRYGKG